MNRLIRSLAAMTLLAALVACGDSKEVSTSAAKPAAPVGNIYEAVSTKATGFTIGSMMAARTVYVFFDPQCPHCATLWQESKPLLGQIRMVWAPVKLIGDLSGRQGAAILAASDPAAEMDKHEQLRGTGGKGIDPPAELPKDLIEKIRVNTELWTSIGGGAVPYMVFKDPANGAPRAYEGAADTEGLRKLFGL